MTACGLTCAYEALHEAAHVDVLSLESERIRGERLLLNRVDVGRSTVRNGVYQGDTDDTDASCKGGEGRSAFLCKEVFEGKTE